MGLKIELQHPLEIDGEVYDSVAVQLAMSPRFSPDRITYGVNGRLIPYRKDAQGVIHERKDHAIPVVIPDAMRAAEGDPVVAQALQAFRGMMQGFVAGKGL